ncbi:MAG TPA: hypothetical protein VNP04_15490 [Alphaproteobacteria bacterium]|nr:hypothetical protein [Alphaproteobacteria bacterium]
MPSLIPRVPIDLDRRRHLVLDYAAFWMIEQRLRRPYHEIFAADHRFSAEEIVTIVWAGLLDEDPDLTPQQVAKWIAPSNLNAVIAAMTEALKISLPEPEPTVGSNGGEPVASPQGLGLTGSPSGPAPVSIVDAPRPSFGN